MASLNRDMELGGQLRRQKRFKAKNDLCLYCNSQIFCAYILSLLSSVLFAGGFYLAIIKWDHMWFILSITGFVLIFIGACMYYCGHSALNSDLKEKQIYRRGKRDKNRSINDHLMTFNNSLKDSRSMSQLSINMIPQYFSNNDTALMPTSQPMALSQIFKINGQSFLILPLPGGETVANTGNTIISLQNLLVKNPDSNIVTSSKHEIKQSKQEIKNLDETLNKNENMFVEINTQNFNQIVSSQHCLFSEPQACTSKSISKPNESRLSFLALTNSSELKLSHESNLNAPSNVFSKQKSLEAKNSFPFEEQRQCLSNCETNFISSSNCSTDITSSLNESNITVKDKMISPTITATTSVNLLDPSLQEITQETTNKESKVENDLFSFCDETTISNQIQPHRSTPPPSYDEVLSIELQTSENTNNFFETL